MHVTVDGVLLAFHDDRLDRVTDGRGAVAATSAAAVARCRVGGREPVPTLDELLDELPDAELNIDLKGPGTPEALARLLARRPARDSARVLVGSFSPRRLRRLRRLAPRVATSAHALEVAAYLVLPGALARRLAPRAVALQVPVRRGRVPVVTPRLVRRAHAAGVEVHVWVVDDPDEVRRLLALGVDGLMTDRTDILKDVLTEQGLW